MRKRLYVLTGGTMVHVTPHFALCAPAYGNVGSEIYQRLSQILSAHSLTHQYEAVLVKTKMAGPNSKETSACLEELGVCTPPETNADLKTLVQALVGDDCCEALIMAAASVILSRWL